MPTKPPIALPNTPLIENMLESHSDGRNPPTVDPIASPNQISFERSMFKVYRRWEK